MDQNGNEEDKKAKTKTMIALDTIIPHLKATSKKQVLLELARNAALLTGIAEKEIFDAIIAREKLGTTGIGSGVAIPHIKLAGLEGMMAIFARLDTPVDYDAVDGQPVDLVYFLLAPLDSSNNLHLKALARVSRLLRCDATCRRLRGATSKDAVTALVVEWDQPNAA